MQKEVEPSPKMRVRFIEAQSFERGTSLSLKGYGETNLHDPS